MMISGVCTPDHICTPGKEKGMRGLFLWTNSCHLQILDVFFLVRVGRNCTKFGAAEAFTPYSLQIATHQERVEPDWTRRAGGRSRGVCTPGRSLPPSLEFCCQVERAPTKVELSAVKKSSISQQKNAFSCGRIVSAFFCETSSFFLWVDLVHFYPPAEPFFLVPQRTGRQ